MKQPPLRSLGDQEEKRKREEKRKQQEENDRAYAADLQRQENSAIKKPKPSRELQRLYKNKGKDGPKFRKERSSTDGKRVSVKPEVHNIANKTTGAGRIVGETRRPKKPEEESPKRQGNAQKIGEKRSRSPDDDESDEESGAFSLSDAKSDSSSEDVTIKNVPGQAKLRICHKKKKKKMQGKQGNSKFTQAVNTLTELATKKQELLSDKAQGKDTPGVDNLHTHVTNVQTLQANMQLRVLALEESNAILKQKLQELQVELQTFKNRKIDDDALKTPSHTQTHARQEPFEVFESVPNTDPLISCNAKAGSDTSNMMARALLEMQETSKKNLCANSDDNHMPEIDKQNWKDLTLFVGNRVSDTDQNKCADLWRFGEIFKEYFPEKKREANGAFTETIPIVYVWYKTIAGDPDCEVHEKAKMLKEDIEALMQKHGLTKDFNEYIAYLESASNDDASSKSSSSLSLLGMQTPNTPGTPS